ncbi:MAG: chemotaxis protein CheA [Fidelibacterota bacterium]
MVDYENNEVVREFLDETLSGFDTIENTMIELENDPENVDLINTIFRPVHSLKGNSAYFGLLKVKKLTHNLENLLDSARKSKIKITPEIITILLSGIDYLREMISRVEEGDEEVVDEERYTASLEKIDSILAEHARPYTISEQEKLEIIEFVKEIKQDIDGDKSDKAQKILSIFSKSSGKEEKQGEIKEVSELKGLLTKSFDDIEASEKDIEEMQTRIDALAGYCESAEAKANYDELLDTFKTFAYSGIGIDDVGQEIIMDKLTALEKHLKPQQAPTDTASQLQKKKPEPEKKQVQKSTQASGTSTIRINEKSLDEFLNYVAELLSIEELFGYMARDLSKYDVNLSSNFKRNMEDFSRISSKLRNGIMDIRKVKADSLLQKTRRIVRDIANKSDKNIDIEIKGEDLKIDKSYIELLDSPLVHMVRNAADHGIEPAAHRKAAGKDETGKITIDLYEEEKNLVLEIIDDGKGLDLEVLKEKAIEKGFIDSEQDLKEEDIINLLFQSGISTAKKVTDVSGRGVGMDVVKRTIESAGGKISVKTEAGKGSTFAIQLPKNVSTKINDVYLVRSFSDEVYALPLKLIEEAFTLDYKDIFSVKNKGNVVKRRGNLLSVFVMDEILNKESQQLKEYFATQNNVPFVYVNFPGKPLAICIKDVVGVQTIVIKDIDSLKFNKKIFDGAATLGDGKIALVINQDWLQSYVSNN